jgi:hypothetical protein
MHADDAQQVPLQFEIDAGRAARLYGGQRDGAGISDSDASFHQQGVAVPADAFGQDRDGRDLPVILLQRLPRQGGDARAEAAIAFLQRDDVGVQFVQHGKNARRIAAAIQPYGLADIVAGESEL